MAAEQPLPPMRPGNYATGLLNPLSPPESLSSAMLECYNFNHEAAVERFREVAAAEPSVSPVQVAAQWGVGYALGVNYNKPELEVEEANDAVAAAAAATSGLEALGSSAPSLLIALVRALTGQLGKAWRFGRGALQTTDNFICPDVFSQDWHLFLR